MNLPPQLEAKFQTLENRYPVKRSALIPMLLYAQDQFGYVSDEMIAEIARRLGLNTLQVTETMAYYSMLRRQPAGKFHVQVCTNVSCMLRGGNKLYEFVQKKLEIGHKETTEDGVFSLEEVECIGACTGAPAMQVNYDFYENLTIERTTQIFEALEAGRKPQTSTPITGSVKERHPAEVPVISRLFGVKDSHKLEVYVANDGYKGHGARAQGIDARASRRRSEEIESARARRRGIPHRHEVELCAQGIGQAQIHSVQRG